METTIKTRVMLALALCMGSVALGAATAYAASISEATTALGWPLKSAYAGTVATSTVNIYTTVAVSVDGFIKAKSPGVTVYSTYQDVFVSYSSYSGTHTYKSIGYHEVDSYSANSVSPSEVH